jgi:predicted secreted protein
MGFISGTVVYIMIWWVFLFMILPWKITSDTKPIPGCAIEAPPEPYLKTKFIITTLIAAVIWLIVREIMALNIIELG